jgi:NADPH:quinone reductase-like Zn-dependent oxidoreductase
LIPSIRRINNQEIAMTRLIQIARAGGPEVLTYIDATISSPAAHEIRIRVRAIGINRAEAMWRTDKYIEPVQFPAGLGYEAAGIVDAVGTAVEGFAVGDTVSVIPSFSMNDYSTYGEVILVPYTAVVKHPSSLSFTDAASIWMMFITAYSALIEDAKVATGDFVIISAASSSVGIAAIQTTNYAGGIPIALTRTSAKARQLLDIGAAHVIATEEMDMVKEVMRITGGKGARIAFDPVGGPTFPKLISALSLQGIVYLYGALSDEPTQIPVLQLIAKMPTIKGHNLWITTGDPVRQKAAVEFILTGVAEGALRPVVDRIFTFDQMRDVHAYLENNGQFGKVVVTM